MSKEREVDLQGNCSKCGGVHFGTGPDCVYGKPEQNRTIPPTLQTGREQPAQGEPRTCEHCGGRVFIESTHGPGKCVPSQPSAGEKPRMLSPQADAELARRMDEYQSAEPSSPPAPAGGAREAEEYERTMFAQFDATAHAIEGGDLLGGTDAKAVMWGFRRLDRFYREVAQLRQERDALRKELDARTNSN